MKGVMKKMGNKWKEYELGGGSPRGTKRSIKKKKQMGLDRGRIVGAMGTVGLCNAKAWARGGGVVRL